MTPFVSDAGLFATRRQLRKRIGQLEEALNDAMTALRMHDDWCGYNPNAPGDPSFNRAWDSFDRANQDRSG